MADEIPLSLSTRVTLLALKRTRQSANITETRVATGLKLNSALDDAVSFFRSRTLLDRADDFNILKEDIDQSVSALKTALNGLENVEQFLSNLLALARTQGTKNQTERTANTIAFNTLLDQTQELLRDADYQGINLLDSTSAQLEVKLGLRTAARLFVDGLGLDDVGPGDRIFNLPLLSTPVFGNGLSRIANGIHISRGFSTIGAANSKLSSLDGFVSELEDARNRVRSHAQRFGIYVSVLETRLSFSKRYIQNLTTGADKLRVASPDEESANLIALQTRRDLGIEVLRSTSDDSQGLVRYLS